MSYDLVVRDRRRSVPVGLRLLIHLLVAIARVGALLPPARLHRVLRLIRRGARPATTDDVARARAEVVAASLRCASREGCLPRSLAATLLCRLRGHWPTWCVGVRVAPPFGAHAWVAVQGRAVGEGVPDGYFTPLLTVPPAAPHRG